MKIFYRLILVLLVIINSGCHSYRPIEVKKSPTYESLSAGDKIFIKTISGERIYLVVKSVDTESISGNHGELIKVSNIAVIEKLEKSTIKTIGLVSIIGGVVFVFISLAMNGFGLHGGG